MSLCKVGPTALAVIKDKTSRYLNPWVLEKRTAPNARKLIDGAIQRVSVSPSRYALHPKVNVERVGYYQAGELNERSSRGAYTMQGDPRMGDEYLRRIVRIHKD